MRSALLGVVLFATAFVGVLLPEAHAVGPTVVESWWEPKYPQSPEQITLLTRVIPDGDPVTRVDAGYCTIPIGTCTFYPMNPIGGDVYSVTVDMYEGAVGSKFLAYAFDGTTRSQGINETITYAQSLSVRGNLVPWTALPGDTVTVSGDVLYNNNASTPAEFTTVTVRLGSSVLWDGATDAVGRFSYSWPASSELGEHALTVTAANRSLTNSYNTALLVVSTPQPDFAATLVEFVPAQPDPGETVSIRAVVSNLGNLAGTGTLTVAVDGKALKTETVTLDPAQDHEVTASWVVTPGRHSVTLTVTGSGDTNHPNDVETLSIGRAEDPPYVMIGAGVGIAAIALVAGALFLRRRKQ